MLTPEFKKVKFLSFILLYVGLTEFCIQCMRIALILFFHLLQISRKAVTCMYAYRELGDIWFIQIPLHMISHPNLDTFFQKLLELMFWKRQKLTPFFTKYCSLHV